MLLVLHEVQGRVLLVLKATDHTGSTMLTVSVKACLLKEYPKGKIGREHFEYTDTTQDLSVAKGQVLVQLLHISVDPYMRSRFTAHLHHFFPPFEPGKPIESLCVAKIIETSNADAYTTGDVVVGMLPWKTIQVVEDPTVLTKLGDVGDTPLTYFLGILGPTGLTAYPPFKELAKPKLTKDSIVMVSGAAGAVGTVFGELCKKIVGCTVYGSAGSAEKIDYCKSLGYDQVFNYKETGIAEGLDSVLEGKTIDLYFDNVAGEFLDECLPRMTKFGLILACGGISKYDDEVEPDQVLKNYMKIVYSSLTLRGFIMPDYLENAPALVGELAGLISEGKVTAKETIVEGFENAHEAFIGLFEGKNIGKMVCTV